MSVAHDNFTQPAASSPDATVRGGRVFRKKSAMASSKPFDYSRARKWAPDADFNDLATFYPQHEARGVLPQEQLLALADKYLDLWQAKMPTSKAMQDKGRKNMLWGIFGSYQKDWETPVLPFAKSCMGGRLTDVDGNEYIDYVGSWGPMILGHAHPAVLDAVRERIAKGLSFGAPTELETMMADKVSPSASESLSSTPGAGTLRAVSVGVK